MKRTPLKRKTPVRKVNAVRRAKMFQRNFDGGIGHSTWIRAHKCILCETMRVKQRTPTQAAHVKSRGAGGDWRQLVPLCFAHHGEQGRLGNVRIFYSYGVDMHAAAPRLVDEHETELAAPKKESAVPW